MITVSKEQNYLSVQAASMFTTVEENARKPLGQYTKRSAQICEELLHVLFPMQLGSWPE